MIYVPTIMSPIRFVSKLHLSMHDDDRGRVAKYGPVSILWVDSSHPNISQHGRPDSGVEHITIGEINSPGGLDSEAALAMQRFIADHRSACILVDPMEQPDWYAQFGFAQSSDGILVRHPGN